MSKKVQQPVINLADTFSEFKDIKNVDRLTMMRVLEDVFTGMIRKKYGDADNFDVILNTERGELEIHRNRLVVENDEVELDHKQVSLSDALKIDEDYEVNDEATDLVNMADFGRRSILSARQTLYTQILELEKEEVFKIYKDREGEIAVGEVYQIWKKELMVIDNDGTELILPKDEMIPSDFYRKGDSLRAVVKEVEMKNGSPRIVLSRTSPMFLERLFELEVPEILEGVIIIKDIVREPGERAKVAVESYDERIDPVGACVGMKGSRIHGIVRELRNESIDVINHTSNLPLYIQRSLNPANISAIKIDEDTKTARVTLVPDQISLAIGKGGHNIRLAGKLVGYTIEVYREEIEGDMADVELTEFLDEIEPWIIDELKAVGCDTASNVLAISTEDLVSRTDLEEETIIEIKRILQAELDK